jgi:hypothetical protein
MTMTNKQTGGPAFPNEGFNGWGEPQQGMTLRDYFAAKAMQAFLTRIPMSGDEQARAAYKVADAMLKAR